MSTLILPAPRLVSPRLMAITAAGSVFGLVSILFLANIPIDHAVIPMRFTPHHFFQTHKAAHHAAALASKSSDEVTDLSRLALHPNRKDYVYTFTGKISCGDQTCTAAAVQIDVETLRNRGIEKVVSIQPDGSYTAKIALQEVPHEQIDWRIMAHTKDAVGMEVRGRQILMDDSAVTVDAPLQI